MKLIKYNWLVVFLFFTSFIPFYEFFIAVIERVLNNKSTNRTVDIIELIILSFFIIFLLLSVFKLFRKKYALKITSEYIEFNLIGTFFHDKIEKTMIKDTIYDSKKKVVIIDFYDNEEFIKNQKSFLVRFYLKRIKKIYGFPMVIKSDLSKENITEIKMILDFFNYGTDENKYKIELDED